MPRAHSALISRFRARLPTWRGLLALALAAAGSGSALAQPRSPDPDQVAALTSRLVNEFRASEGRKAVSANERLGAAARYFADYVAKTGKMSHEADGRTPAARAKQRGYEYCIISENIAYRYSSEGFDARELAAGFVEGWKSSPGHRKNMLEPDVTETGVAVARGKPGHYYAVQIFGRPISQSVSFSVANRSDAGVRYRIEDKTFSLGPRQTRKHQHCRSSEVVFELPGKARGAKVMPKNGATYSVVRAESGALSLENE